MTEWLLIIDLLVLIKNFESQQANFTCCFEATNVTKGIAGIARVATFGAPGLTTRSNRTLLGMVSAVHGRALLFTDSFGSESTPVPRGPMGRFIRAGSSPKKTEP